MKEFINYFFHFLSDKELSIYFIQIRSSDFDYLTIKIRFTFRHFQLREFSIFQIIQGNQHYILTYLQFLDPKWNLTFYFFIDSSFYPNDIQALSLKSRVLPIFIPHSFLSHCNYFVRAREHTLLAQKNKILIY